MRSLQLFFALCVAVVCGFAAPAAAAVPQLSFESGASILRNPTDDDFVIRSANVDQVRLTLYRVEQPDLLNQIMAARATQSVTEEGMRDRVMSEAKVMWRARFVLGRNQTSAPIALPLSVAAGQLPPGIYMLAADTDGVPTALQWFHIGDLTVHVVSLPPGNLVLTTHRAAAVPVNFTRLTLLDAKGAPLREAPNDWQTDASGAVFWSGPWPATAALLRADDATGNTAFLPLITAEKQQIAKTKAKGIMIAPLFDGNSVPVGTTAGFDISLRDETDTLVQQTLRYEFARVAYTYRWLRDSQNNWQYQTTARPTVIERGTLRPNRGAGTGQAIRLLLAVTEGRFRLTVSTPDGALRNTYEFVAGWWRSLPIDADDMTLTTNLVTANQLQITVPDRAETDAPRWAVVWRPDGPETRMNNGPLITLPDDRVGDKPLIAGQCVPGRDKAPVVCSAMLVQPQPAASPLGAR